MKAIVYRQYGGPQQLETADVAEPTVGPDVVLVQARAASVNPVDWKLREGYLDGFIEAWFPVIPGWDVAGVVEQPGIAVPEFVAGDEVIGYVRQDVVRNGTYAQKVAAPVRTLARKPHNLDWEQAATLPLAGLTAYQTIVHTLQTTGSDTVLVHAAAGGVGSFAVQVARSLGARVIGTASEPNHDYVRSLGAEPVTYGPDLADRVGDIAPVTAALDLVGGDAVSQSQQLGVPARRIASVADPAVNQIGGSYVFVRPNSSDLAALVDLVEAGKVTVEVAETFPLERAAEAQRRNAQGHTRGKIALSID